MSEPVPNRSVQFFDAQFKGQVERDEFALNPFEQAVLPFIRGKVLDLGCGLGNLSIAAARSGASVLALDASAHAIDALKRRADEEHLTLSAEMQDLASYVPQEQFDSVLCIGLLMFFPPVVATHWLEQIKALTRTGGIAAVNVLIEGTTYLDMFEPDGYTLFSENEVLRAFDGWEIEYSAIQEFAAPGATHKRFSTLVARKK